MQTGRSCRIHKSFERPCLSCFSLLSLLQGTFGISSSQTPFSRSGNFSVSYRTSSFSHLKTVSFLVFATYKTGIFCLVCESPWIIRKKSILVLNPRPKKNQHTWRPSSCFSHCHCEHVLKAPGQNKEQTDSPQFPAFTDTCHRVHGIMSTTWYTNILQNGAHNEIN